MGVSRVRARVNWRKAVKVALTVLVLAAVLLRFPAAGALAALQRLDPLWVAVGTACMVLDRVVFVTRWHLLLAPIGVRQSLLYSLGVAMVGYFYGMIAISTLGLDAARVILPAQRHRVRKADLAACVFVDRLAGIVAISTMGLVPLIAGQRGAIRASLLTVTAMGAAGLLFFAWLATLQSPVSGTRGGRARAPCARRGRLSCTGSTRCCWLLLCAFRGEGSSSAAWACGPGAVHWVRM